MNFRAWPSIAARAAPPGATSGRFRTPGAVRDTLQPAAEAVPHPQLPRHLLRQSQPAVPAAPDRPLLGAVRGAHHARGLRAGHRRGGQGARRSQRRSQRASCRRAWRQAAERAASSSARRRSATSWRRCKRIQAQQIVTAEGERDVDVFAIVGEPGRVRHQRHAGARRAQSRAPPAISRARRWPSRTRR